MAVADLSRAHVRPSSPKQATLLCHTGHGPVHYDLVMNTGAYCVTLRFERSGHGWRWSEQPNHRRRYLSVTGPVPLNRGRITQCWHGFARWGRLPRGYWIWLEGSTFVLREHRVVIQDRVSHCRPCHRLE